MVSVVYDVPIEDGDIDLCVANLRWRDRQDVLREHDNVGQLSRLERSLDALFETGVGRSKGECAHSFGDRDLLFGYPSLGVLPVQRAAGYGSVDADNRIHGRNVPVRP